MQGLTRCSRFTSWELPGQALQEIHRPGLSVWQNRRPMQPCHPRRRRQFQYHQADRQGNIQKQQPSQPRAFPNRPPVSNHDNASDQEPDTDGNQNSHIADQQSIQKGNRDLPQDRVRNDIPQEGKPGVLSLPSDQRHHAKRADQPAEPQTLLR